MLGSVGQLPTKTRRKPASAAKTEPEDNADPADTQLSEVIDLDPEKVQAEVPADVWAERRLRMIVEQSGQSSQCFLGLVPTKILDGMEKNGRQISGVPCSDTATASRLAASPQLPYSCNDPFVS